jgi:S1-C subfamily serine protease
VAILRVEPGSAAQAAGLRGVRSDAEGRVVAGDVIVALEGTPVDSVARLTSRLDDHRIGETVRLKVLRDGREIEVDVRLQAGNE